MAAVCLPQWTAPCAVRLEYDPTTVKLLADEQCDG